jgi:hypothetical protein
MATNDYEEAPATREEQLRMLFGQASQAVTGATNDVLPLRVFLLLMTIGACMVWASTPFNIIGLLATIALAFSVPVARRR